MHTKQSVRSGGGRKGIVASEPCKWTIGHHPGAVLILRQRLALGGNEEIIPLRDPQRLKIMESVVDRSGRKAIVVVEG